MQALLHTQSNIENNLLKFVLQQAGFLVESSKEIDASIEKIPEHPYDLLLISLSSMTSESLPLVKKIRALTVTGLILISDPLNEAEHIKFLESGADLVVFRPYSSELLLSQIHAIMRRAGGVPFHSLPTLSQSGVELDPASRSVKVEDSTPKHLTQLEFRLLYMLMTHAGQIIENDAIVENVWGFKGQGNRELVRGLMQRLRAKVEPEPKKPKYILTDPGVGYSFIKE